MNTTLEWLKPAGLFAVTALAELAGCYLPLLWLEGRAPVWVLVPAVVCLTLFVWLLTLHPHPAGRVYAAYGGMYIAMAVAWLWFFDGLRPDRWDLLGTGIALVGAAVIYFAPRTP